MAPKIILCKEPMSVYGNTPAYKNANKIAGIYCTETNQKPDTRIPKISETKLFSVWLTNGNHYTYPAIHATCSDQGKAWLSITT